MTNDLPVSNTERTEALAWLRDVLNAMVEVCPLSYQQKKRTTHFLNKLPDWLMSKWADALNIDYMGGYAHYPDMMVQAYSSTGRQLAKQYLESHNTVAVGNCLKELGKSVVRYAQTGDLPVDIDMVERQVCALALAGCIDDGAEVARNIRGILRDAENHNHPVVDYNLALEYGDRTKLESLDAALTGGRYGSWVAERLTEVKRFLGLEPPHFTIHVGERTPQWDLLWKRVFTGGDE